MKAICTICSKNKNGDKSLLPARLRYSSPHIRTTENIALNLKQPFFILSGKYGLIPADEMIPDYDYYLEEDKIDSLSHKIAHQLHEQNITELGFYTERKPTWARYEAALQKGADLAKVVVITYTL